jgi:transposase-like protein
MIEYTAEFRVQAVEKALKQGIKPTVRELELSGNTLRKWIKGYKTAGISSFIKYRQPYNRTGSEIEKFVVYLKERKPTITLKEIQRIINMEKSKVLSINGIERILKRFSMTGKNFLPLRGEDTSEIQKGMKLARFLLAQGNFKKAARVLNSLPTLSDFSILEKIPSQLLSLRRQVEQLNALWSTLPMAERYKKARELRKQSEKEKSFFTGMFVAFLEMNALNFLGKPTKVFSLYKKYRKYLSRLPLPLKYKILSECFLSFLLVPEKYSAKILKKFPNELAHFCTKLPEGVHRVYWYNMVSDFFLVIGKINKSLEWKEKLLPELSPKDRKEYLPTYLSLLSLKGSYAEIFKFNEPFKDISFLRASLSRAEASLGMGKPTEALEIALNIFYKAKREHLILSMSQFTFFIACAYSALKETKKAKQYLKMSRYFSRNIKRRRILSSLLLGVISPVSYYSRDPWVNLTKLYLLACKTLRKKNYLKAYKFAERKGFLGFFHRIAVFHPEVVINLLKKGKETYLPKEFLTLPVFHEATPMFKLFLLRDKESIFYGDRKINISPHTKDFHLLTYLFLNRKKTLDKENLINIFYKDVSNPSQCLIKALSRIRNCFSLPKGVLSLRKTGVFFDIEAEVDLEKFEESYKLGRISEKVGEVQHALREYQECFMLYKKSPFEQTGYYYNFAEERRTFVRNMYKELCDFLIMHAQEKGKNKIINKIRRKLKREILMV